VYSSENRLTCGIDRKASQPSPVRRTLTLQYGVLSQESGFNYTTESLVFLVKIKCTVADQDSLGVDPESGS